MSVAKGEAARLTASVLAMPEGQSEASSFDRMAPCLDGWCRHEAGAAESPVTLVQCRH